MCVYKLSFTRTMFRKVESVCYSKYTENSYKLFIFLLNYVRFLKIGFLTAILLLKFS